MATSDQEPIRIPELDRIEEELESEKVSMDVFARDADPIEEFCRRWRWVRRILRALLPRLPRRIQEMIEEIIRIGDRICEQRGG
jgi:hypothetical protein